MHRKIKMKNNKLMVFLGMPLIFVLLSYLLILIAGSPVIDPMRAVFSLAFGKTMPVFDAAQNVDTSALKLVSVSETQQPAIAASTIQFPSYGDKYARVSIPGTGVDCDVYYGDGNSQFKQGAGQYIGSKLPGFGGTILIAAHKTTYFMDLKSVKAGDIIQIQTGYGAYEYTVREMKIVDPNDKSAYDLSADKENLILYTCYPFNMMGFSKQRYFVYADYTSGPQVDVAR